MSTFLSKDQIMALAVKLIGIAGGALVTRGAMTPDQLETIQTGLPTLIGVIGVLYTVIYSFWKNRTEKQIADVANKPDVSVTVTSPDLAAKVAKVDPNASVAAP